MGEWWGGDPVERVKPARGHVEHAHAHAEYAWQWRSARPADQKRPLPRLQVCLCQPGNLDDEIVERNIHKKVGAARGEDDDGRDSEEEESGDEVLSMPVT